MKLLLSSLAFFAMATTLVAEEPMRLLTWNVESGGSSPQTIAKQLRELKGYDIYVLTEAVPSGKKAFTQAVSGRKRKYDSVTTETGGADRVQILYDQQRFELIGQTELHKFKDDALNDEKQRHRSPLILTLKDRSTEVTFKLVGVHFAYGDKELRRSQARGLRLWADEQAEPLLALGCFNFYYRSDKGGNDSFGEFMLDYIWRWREPEKLIDTNWSDRDKDGKDDYPNSILDFAYVANQARVWEAKSRVIVREGDFPDDKNTSDHRPVELVIHPR